jgi:hypothetical protein
MTIGTWINGLMDRVLPDVVGDMTGVFVDAATGRPDGVVKNAVDLSASVLEACAPGSGACQAMQVIEAALDTLPLDPFS